MNVYGSFNEMAAGTAGMQSNLSVFNAVVGAATKRAVASVNQAMANAKQCLKEGDVNNAYGYFEYAQNGLGSVLTALSEEMNVPVEE